MNPKVLENGRYKLILMCFLRYKLSFRGTLSPCSLPRNSISTERTIEEPFRITLNLEVSVPCTCTVKMERPLKNKRGRKPLSTETLVEKI